VITGCRYASTNTGGRPVFARRRGAEPGRQQGGGAEVVEEVAASRDAVATECRTARSDSMAGALSRAGPRKAPRAVGQRGRRLSLCGDDGADPCLEQLTSCP
jgi:hypothetical protein